MAGMSAALHYCQDWRMSVFVLAGFNQRMRSRNHLFEFGLRTGVRKHTRWGRILRFSTIHLPDLT